MAYRHRRSRRHGFRHHHIKRHGFARAKYRRHYRHGRGGIRL